MIAWTKLASERACRTVVPQPPLQEFEEWDSIFFPKEVERE